ncbi:MAG: hypothetical protein J7L96_01615, partial [Bacteroidales bacterium]|nr:hypothetical protein [Bacteroidales bacterium]
MNIIKYLVIVYLSLATPGYLLAQEQLRSLGENILQKDKVHVTKTQAEDLSLPFIDDFSSTRIFPDQSKWIDYLAYINNSLPYHQPGYGVASLDAMDSTGAIYADANTSGFIADYLTSRSIDLNVGADTSVYLSFYYQPQGLGDQPEPEDSLILEFFAPEIKRWVWIWSKAGSSLADFKQVMIPVRGAIFMKNGFQFRFSNRASLANAFEPSLKTNADHWHIDYVYLDRNRNYQDTVLNDLSLKAGSGSLLLEYSAIPWEHFRELGISGVKTIFPVDLANLSAERKFYSPVFTISDDYGTTAGFEKELLADEIQAFQEIKYDATFNYGFTSDAADSAIFTITLDLHSTEQDLVPGNDRIQYQQVFTNYYAYDDGSAEAGYGLVGEGTANARVACRFNNYHTVDSLVGMQIFFNRSFEDANRKYFQLAIWNEVDGKPGDLLYKQQGTRASLTTGLDGFDYFKLDTAQLTASAFYIGWYQVTTDFLNVGFDLNTNNQDKLFYNTAMDWKSSSFSGS